MECERIPWEKEANNFQVSVVGTQRDDGSMCDSGNARGVRVIQVEFDDGIC